MIWIDPPLVADLCKSAHAGDDVAIALVDKSLSIPIVRFFDPHVAKVHRADAISPAKVADRLCRIFTVFGRNARVKEYAIGPTVDYIDQTFNRIQVPQRLCNTALDRHRRIVGMQRQTQPRALGHGHDRAQEKR